MKYLIPTLAFAFGFVFSIAAQNISLGNDAVTRAVVIGISDYQDEKITDLQFAHKDAEAFAAWLQSPSGGALPEDNIKLLLNEEATTAQFDAALGWLMEHSKEGDQAIIYFSGHGDVDSKLMGQEGFLLCWDTPPQSYRTGAYSLHFLKIVVSTLSIQNNAKVLVITDACRSGILEGNIANGAQYTNANLAKMYAKEIKILSCQPNEYSVEGEDWGGGHGVFTFNLIDALYGMADGNRDLNIELREIDRYLEDHVTPQVAPVSQVPLIVGNKTERISIVNEEVLALWQNAKKGQPLNFKPIKQKGLVDEVLAKVDTSIKELYYAFATAVDEKVFLEPADSCADAYYRQLIAIPELKPLYGAMTRNFAAALQDDAQQAINGWLRSDPKEVESYATLRGIQYLKFPNQLERAASLLGEQHYMYNDLKAKKSFFQARGLIMQKGDMGGTGWDSLSLAELKSYVEEGLDCNDQAPYLYAKQAYYYWGIETLSGKLDPEKRARASLKKALELAPNWKWAFGGLIGDYLGYGQYDLADKLMEKAPSFDSTFRPYYSQVPLVLHEFEAYAKVMQKEIAYRLSEKESELYGINRLYLARAYFSNGLSKESKEIYEEFVERLEESKESLNNFDFTWLHEPYMWLGWIHLFNGQYNEAKILFDKAIALQNHEQTRYYNGECYLGMAIIAQKTNDLSNVAEYYEKAIDGIPFYWLVCNSLSKAGMFDYSKEMIELFERALKKYPDENDLLHFHIGMLYLRQLKDIEKAIFHLGKAAQLTEDKAFIHYYLSTAYIQNGKKTAAFKALQQALEMAYYDLDRIQREPAFEKWRTSKEFEKLMQPYVKE